MFDKINSDGSSALPAYLINPREQAKWIRKLSDLTNASAKIMTTDAVLSNGAQRQSCKFDELTEGTIDDLSGGNLRDNTNHFSRQRNNVGLLPEGANTAYADGHADWRSFARMNPRVETSGMYFWW